MNIELDKLKDYKQLESSIITNADIKHLENYKQLITFFENALADSTKEGNTDFPKLLSSCIQCIRYLDGIISSYDTALLSTRKANILIDEIIKNNIPLEVGNEQVEESLTNNEKSEQDQ